MRQPNVTVYGSRNCPDTRRTTEFLDGQSIPYEFKSVDDFPEFNDYIADLNGGKRVMPTVQVNNEVFFNPPEDVLSSAVAMAAAQAEG